MHHVTGPLALPAQDSGQPAVRVANTAYLSGVLTVGHLHLSLGTSCIAATTLVPRSLRSSLIISLEEFPLGCGCPSWVPPGTELVT